MRQVSPVATRWVRVAALWGMLCAPALAQGDEPLWTEGRHAAGPPAAGRLDFVKLSESLAPSVVYIAGRSGNVGDVLPSNFRRRLENDSGSGKSVGTGFIIHKNGTILTNYHVIERADEVRVRLADGRDFSAQVVGGDEKTDIALLKVEVSQPLPAAPLGDSDRLRVGEWVVAIGNPYGEFERSVTAGIISAVGRNNVKPAGKEDLYANFIQTDAAINLGNSGGPLINTAGEVVGIASAIYRRPGTPDFHDAQNISFAIPINMAKALIPLLAKYGRAPRSWLGVDIQPVSHYLSHAFRLAHPEGALVADVREGSPAQKAGLHAGDVIVEFHGRRITNANDLPWFASITPAGEHVAMMVWREGAEQKLMVTMSPHPDEKSPPPLHAREARVTPSYAPEPVGITVAEPPPQWHGRGPSTGVIVTDVADGSAAVEAGVDRDDIIVRVGKTAVATPADFEHAVAGIPRGGLVLILLRRSEKPFWVAFPKR